MYGPPKDIPGLCNARLYIGDDFGDNRATMLCQLPPGHTGPHREDYNTTNPHGPGSGTVTIEWTRDEREDDK
jgi:hypothetical protein